ncbi:hypothetical protein [uncultured Thiodictyon sp.]|uniref:PDC sensor domain-containing protein n=1 Tax=uncultured Thiodictyon sp. TaxID=1846217 RepID=UPI0025E488B7|nr:hypothetical protein [uncultured Thiodictyon sp.]
MTQSPIESPDAAAEPDLTPARPPKSRVWLLWLTAGLICVGILGSSAYVSQATYGTEIAQATHEAGLTVDAFSAHTMHLLNHVDALLHGLRWVYRQTGSLAQTEHSMDALAFDRTAIHNLYLIGPQGTILISHDPAARNRSVADREYFRFHAATPQDRLFISAVEPGRITGRYHFRITRRIDNPDGSFGGLVLAAVDPQSFTGYCRELHIGTQDVTALLGTGDRRLRARIPEPSPEQWAAPIASSGPHRAGGLGAARPGVARHRQPTPAHTVSAGAVNWPCSMHSPDCRPAPCSPTDWDAAC